METHKVGSAAKSGGGGKRNKIGGIKTVKQESHEHREPQREGKGEKR